MLSAREHFLCHILLCKMVEKGSYSWQKMVHAAIMMRATSEGQKRYVNSRLFCKCREEYTKVKSAEQSGEGNSQFGTIWIHSKSLRLSKKIRSIEIPDGWERGKFRLPSKRIERIFKERQTMKERKQIQDETKKQRFRILYDRFIESGLSLRKFTKIEYDKSHVSLYKFFVKYGFIVR